MPGMFDGFSLSIFDDAIFDTKLVIPSPLKIRQRATLGVPPTSYSVRVVDA